MPANKNQHYVPSFYFRLFSRDGKLIEIYNVNKKQYYTGPISHSASRGYFYGKTGEIEKALNILEGAQAPVIQSIISESTLQKLTQKEYVPLYHMITIQNTRTMNAKAMGDQMVQHFSDLIVKPLLGPNPGVKLVYPAMHALQMLNALQLAPLLFDLGMVLLINHTNRNFIFSDNPVVFFNTFFNDVTDNGVLGLQSPGLQIFFPISDKLAIYLYDVECYATASRGTDLSTIPIQLEADVDAINTLQLLDCNENVYFSDKQARNYISSLHDKISGTRQTRQAKMKEIAMQDRDQERKIVQFYDTQIHYPLSLSFVKLDSNYKIGKLARQPIYASMVTTRAEENFQKAKRRLGRKKKSKNPKVSSLGHDKP